MHGGMVHPPHKRKSGSGNPPPIPHDKAGKAAARPGLKPVAFFPTMRRVARFEVYGGALGFDGATLQRLRAAKIM
jgi:hypothetical protein